MKALKIIAGLIVLVVAIGFAMQDQIVNRIIEKRAVTGLSTSGTDAYADTLTVAICGAGSPIWDPQRSGACSLVIAGDQVIMIDAGNGVDQLTAMGLPAGLVNAVFLTHFHSDHINALGELMTQRWAGSGTKQSLPVYGPNGVEKIVNGFNMAYADDRIYREEHHTTAVMPPSGGLAMAQPFAPSKNGIEIFNNNGLTVTAFQVDHEPVAPSVGYKVAYKGRSIVFSGDTAKDQTVEHFSMGSDVLVHEALSPEVVGLINAGAAKANRPRIVKITDDILNYHTTPVEAAEIASASKVPFLLFSHIVPQLPISNLEKRFVKGVSDVYDGEFKVAKDGSIVSIDLESGEITSGDLLF